MLTSPRCFTYCITRRSIFLQHRWWGVTPCQPPLCRLFNCVIVTQHTIVVRRRHEAFVSAAAAAASSLSSSCDQRNVPFTGSSRIQHCTAYNNLAVSSVCACVLCVMSVSTTASLYWQRQLIAHNRTALVSRTGANPFPVVCSGISLCAQHDTGVSGWQPAADIRGYCSSPSTLCRLTPWRRWCHQPVGQPLAIARFLWLQCGRRTVCRRRPCRADTSLLTFRRKT